MKRRQWRWTTGFLATAAGVSLLLVAPILAAPSATAGGDSAPPALVLGASGASRGQANSLYSGYYENLVGAVSLSATFTVPTVKCTNHSTWGTQVGLLGLMDSSSGQAEHGGGVEVGCNGGNGDPTYTGALCDPSFPSGCGVLADPVTPGDLVKVTVVATGGCSPTCSSVTVTVADTTAAWTETWTGTSDSDFDTFVAVVGSPPVPAFTKVAVTDLSVNGKGFSGQRYNLVNHSGKTLARASALGKGRASFTVKWVASS